MAIHAEKSTIMGYDSDSVVLISVTRWRCESRNLPTNKEIHGSPKCSAMTAC